MALLPQTTDFTDLDFDSLRLRLQNLIRSVFPDWTDFNVANFGNILVELFAFVGEILTFYQNNQGRESRLVTATQRKNVIGLLKLIGFRLSGATAATAEITFSLAEPPAADVTLPAGTVVRTQEVTDPIRFQLLSDVTIAAGANPPTGSGTAENSQSHQELFDSTDLSHQEFSLTFDPYLDDSAIVSAGNGAYAAAPNLLNSGPSDRHFTITVDQNDRATLRFGDGLQGAVPTGTVQVDYKTGGGPQGNVDPDRIVVVEGTFVDAFGNPVQVTATNSQSASGGAPRQSIDSARIQGPASLRSLNRTVSREDYENNALKLGDVARALMLTADEDVTIGENSGILFVIPQGGGVPTETLKDQVLNQVTVVFPNTLTFQVSVQDPVYKTIDVSATVFLRAGFNAATVKAAIEQALADFFSLTSTDALGNVTPNDNIDFGFNIKDGNGNPAGEVAWSDLFGAVRRVPGVRKIGDGDSDFLLNGTSDDVPLLNKDFPVLGAVTLSNGDTGGPL